MTYVRACLLMYECIWYSKYDALALSYYHTPASCSNLLGEVVRSYHKSIRSPTIQARWQGLLPKPHFFRSSWTIGVIRVRIQTVSFFSYVYQYQYIRKCSHAFALANYIFWSILHIHTYIHVSQYFVPSDIAIMVRNTTTSTKFTRLQFEQVMYGLVWKTCFLNGSLVLYPLGSNFIFKLFEVDVVDPSSDSCELV